MKGNYATTYLMMPFYLKKAFNGTLPESCFWIRKDMTLETNTFFPYLQQFLTDTAHRTHDEKQVQPYDYYIYTYEDHSELYRAIESHEFYIDVKEQNGDSKWIVRLRTGKDYSKKGERNSFSTPKLIICPIAEVGILIFSMEIQVPTNSLKALQDLNYKLRHNKQDTILHVSYEKQFEDFNQQLSDFDSKGSRKTEAIKQASFKKAINIWKNLCDDASHLRTLFGKSTTKADNDQFGGELLCLEETPTVLNVDFRFNMIQELLMAGLDGWYERFNSDMNHLFTFIELEHTEVTPELLDDFHHITTCTNSNYQMLKFRFEEQCTQTFENVYVGSSVEGGAMMIVKPKPSTDFWDGFGKGQFDKRYMWFYIMALMQRHTLIHQIYKLTKIYTGNKTSVRLLREEVDKTSKLGVNTYFSVLTDHTQHHIFYEHCKKNLNIDMLRNELSEKMEMLNDNLESKSDRIKERQQRILAILVAILTIFSATNDGMDVVLKKFDEGAQAFYHLHEDDWLVRNLHDLYHIGNGVWSFYVLISVICLGILGAIYMVFQYIKTNNK